MTTCFQDALIDSQTTGTTYKPKPQLNGVIAPPAFTDRGFFKDSGSITTISPPTGWSTTVGTGFSGNAAYLQYNFPLTNKECFTSITGFYLNVTEITGGSVDVRIALTDGTNTLELQQNIGSTGIIAYPLAGFTGTAFPLNTLFILAVFIIKTGNTPETITIRSITTNSNGLLELDVRVIQPYCGNNGRISVVDVIPGTRYTLIGPCLDSKPVSNTTGVFYVLYNGTYALSAPGYEDKIINICEYGECGEWCCNGC
jgi:hypothetical protein